MLDLYSVHLFVLAAEYGSLTRAAEAMGTVQPAVSARIKALEERLGAKLLDRTSRYVRPTGAGAAFLPRARALLAAHDAAVHLDDTNETQVAVGLSEHALGLGLGSMLRQLRAALPAGASLSVTMGLSQMLSAGFDEGRFDAIVIRREVGAGAGEVLGRDPLGWRGTAVPGPVVKLATLGPPCGVREAALRVLDANRMPWKEVFLAGSCTALMAAAHAGLGLAPMGRIASDGAPDVGPDMGLPTLPDSEVVLLGRAGSPLAGAALRALAAGVRGRLAG